MPSRTRKWNVWYWWDGRWNRDSEFLSKRAAADYGGRIFSLVTHWKILRKGVRP